MAEGDAKRERGWREIAEEISAEHQPGRVTELSQELVRALDEEAVEKAELMTKSESGMARRKSA